MKKIFLMVSAVVLLAACNGSKKGAWSEDDKKLANEEIKKAGSSLDALGDKKDAYVDCYLEKLEDNYENFDAANSDQKGCEKHAMDCATEIILGK
ncbi:MAG: hypothetical protein EBS86_17780 [Crocinitomicaceae bacterium]|jgi:hypothetical protein|nr:hypothetical protein [Crocinitomicaceae bacterium]